MDGCVLRRGFKTEAEKTAERVRRELNLRSHEPLSARAVIRHLQMALFAPQDIKGMPPEALDVLLGSGSGSWSAVTIEHPNMDLVIYNPCHTARRQEADLMHEASHKLCGHKPEPMTFVPDFPFPLRTYDETLEAEAECLGATMQLPRVALLWALEQKMTNEIMAEHFTASLDMVRFRRSTTGVDKQINYRSRMSSKLA